MNKLILAAMISLLTSTAYAGTASDALSTCLADNTTGKDRKELARWIFVAISVHPEIRDVANVSKPEREKSNKAMGGMVTRLLAEHCPTEVKAALQAEGGKNLEASFGVLGQLAVMELMSDQAVSLSIMEYAQHLDKARLKAVLGE